MTYEQCKNYKSDNRDVRDEFYLDDPDFKINYVLIAPKSKTFEDRMKVLHECLHKDPDNYQALENLKFLEEELDVYVIHEISYTEFKEALLADHLAHKTLRD